MPEGVWPPDRPVIGLVGSEGAYGRWLRRFFETQMALEVLGHDPAASDGVGLDALLEAADVLLFCTPIRHTVAVIEDAVARSGGRERGRLWLDVTSIKAAPVAAMLRSRAEVVGLHPMTAPPRAPTLAGRVLVIDEARLERWRPWFQGLRSALAAECVWSDAERHDRIMALVQALVHATHLAQAGVLRGQVGELGDLSALLPFRSVSFELDASMIARILAQNPAIYEDIQFCNPHVLPVLDRLLGEIAALRDLVAQGDDAARAAFRARFLDAARAAMAAALPAGSARFERLGYLLADLSGARAIDVHLPRDAPGSLRALLALFERHGISLDSLHSARTASGALHFRIGLPADVDAHALSAVRRELEGEGLGRVVG